MTVRGAAKSGGNDDLGVPGPPFDRNAPYLRGLLLGLGLLTAVLFGWALHSISGVIVQVIVAFFIASGLHPLVRWIENRGLKRAWAVLCVAVLALAGLAVFLFALVPVITDQVTAITDHVPTWLDQLTNNTKIRDLDADYHFIEPLKAKLVNADFVTGIFGGVLGVSLKVLGAFFSAFVVIVLTLYFLASYEQFKRAIYSLAPASRRDRVTKLGDRILDGVGGYVLGAFAVAVCAGVSTFIMLFIVGMGSYAVALAFVVALLDVVPLIGATLGAVIVCAIGFTNGIGVGITLVIFYVVYQQVENYLIYPNVMSRSVNVPGSITVIAALIGAALLGVVGALLAIPAAAAVLLLIRELVVKPQNSR